MPRLVLGPLLRYVGERDATVWVETDAACEVEVLGCRARTWCVAGHHYALVHVEGLEPGTETPYAVTLDGARAWPEAGSAFPPSAIRTLPVDGCVRIAFGSCRLSLPHEPPYTLSKDEDDAGREVDALHTFAHRMIRGDSYDWPHLVFLAGDQVYADDVPPDTERFIAGRRSGGDGQPPVDEVADFEEYCRLYLDAWREPTIRWVLSTVASAMVFDDHDVHDDWNTSQAWVEQMRRKPWWGDRIRGAFMSYWIYQHLGNLSPRELDADDFYQEVRGLADAGPALEAFAARAEREHRGVRWSYYRDLGRTRLLVLDSRAGRVLDEPPRRMVDDEAWAWIVERATGDFDHLLLGTTLPWLLAPGMHHLEAWNEAVADGAWGRWAVGPAEKLRQGLDLEHWAAFGESFRRLCELVAEVGSGRRGSAPASIVALSGDVHHAYLARVGFRRSAGVRSTVWQAVCSPVRNPLDARERMAIRIGGSRGARWLARTLARLARVPDPDVRWRIDHGPWFDNQLATIEVDGRRAVLRLERAVDGADGAVLERVLEERLA